MKKVLLGISCLIFNLVFSMERAPLNDGKKHLSVIIDVKQSLTNRAELKRAIEEAEGWQDVLDSYDIKPRALAEFLILEELGRQTMIPSTLKVFKDLRIKNPLEYNACVTELVQELCEKKNTEKEGRTNVLLEVQQQLRRNIVENTYQVKGEIAHIKPEYKKLRGHYIAYFVRSVVYALISLTGFAGLGYFGWVLYQCEES